MTTYLALSAGIIFLTVLLSFIIPEGKLNKSINFVVRIACIFILVSPIISIFDFSATTASDDLVDYDYLCRVYSDSQSKQLEDMIFDAVGVECDCVVEFTYEDGVFKENGVTVLTDFDDSVTIGEIQAYLKELGYININVNEESG